ncbi:hypothetical protein SXCC_04536 [Gluconacetobacter sp. SXCC-1]|nr:hypothetical protein SXCC_04536 [Gluconacetobacter sp. SXCC-1]
MPPDTPSRTICILHNPLTAAHRTGRVLCAGGASICNMTPYMDQTAVDCTT